MSQRIIAVITNDDLGLIEETEIVGATEDLKNILVELGYAKFYDDTNPLPPKGLNDYEPGMVYPKDRFILKNDSLYISKQITSSTWVLSEWDIKISGTASV